MTSRSNTEGDDHARDRDRRRPPRSPEPYRKSRASPSRPSASDPPPRRSSSRDRRGGTLSNRRRPRSGSRDRGQDRRDGSTERRRHRHDESRRGRDGHKDRDRDREADGHGDGYRRRHRSRQGMRGDRSLRSRSSSASPPPKRRRHPSSSASPPSRRRKPLPSQEVSFRGLDDSTLPPSKYGGAPKTLEKPNFKPTGLLAKAANKVEGTKISLKYHEPAEARKPPSSAQWRLFVFKGDDVVDTIELYTRSCWLLGRSHEVVDHVLEHPSSSGQHAVIQFRYMQKTVEDEFGVKQQRGRVKPYIIDLESSNGTKLNGRPIETSRYLELRDKDILQFGGSEKEYVVMLPPPGEPS